MGELNGTDGRVRVFLVEDQTFVRDATRAALEQVEGIEVVGEASGFEEARPLLQALRPAVVLLDHRLHGESGIEGAAWIQAELPAARSVLLTAYVSPELVRRAQSAGVAGFVCKGSSGIEEVVAAIRAVAQGASYFDPTASRARASGRRLGERLTPAEEDVLRALVRTRASNRALAASLSVGESTIATHVRSLIAKTDAKNRSDLARWGEEHGFF
jgi:DNA-binding NarL/FixJ family response regulator